MPEHDQTPPFSPTLVPRRLDVTARTFKSGVLIDNGVALNPTAADIFLRCDGRTPIAEVVEGYRAAYGLDAATAEADVHAVLRDLLENDTIAV
jgi:hypothetical protein